MAKSPKIQKIEAGQIIQCPDCKAHLLQFKKDLLAGEKFTMDYVTALRDTMHLTGPDRKCSRCGGYFMENGAIHLISGWYPYHPGLSY